MNITLKYFIQSNYDKITQPYIISYMAVTALASLAGVCGNSMTIVTFLETSSLRETRNFFIINLAIADLLVNGIVMPYSIFGVLVGKLYFDFHPMLCRFLSTVCAPGCLASMFTICLISCARYFYICKYSIYLKFFTKTRSYVYMASLWMLCFLIHSPNHVGWGHSDRFAVGFEICTLDMREFSYSMFYGCWMVTAMGTTFYFYYCIYKLLKTSKLSRKMITKENSVAPSRLQCAWVSSADFGTTAKNSPLKAGDFGPVINKKKSVGPLENATEIRNEIRLIKTSFKIFLLFVVLWTPTSLLILMGENDFVPKPVYLYGLLMAHSNSTMNFVIYYLDNKPFRNGFWDIVKRMTGCVGRCEVDAVGARFSKNQRLANDKNLMKP